MSWPSVDPGRSYSHLSRSWLELTLIPILSNFKDLKSLAFRVFEAVYDAHVLLGGLPSQKRLLLPMQSTLSEEDLAGLSEEVLLPNLEMLCCTITPQSLKVHLNMLNDRRKSPGGTARILGILVWHFNGWGSSAGGEHTVIGGSADLIVKLKQENLLSMEPTARDVLRRSLV